MSYQKLNNQTFASPEAEAALNAVNSLIDQVAAESKSLESDAAALLAQAGTTEPEDAGKLFKAVDALRIRRMKNHLQELRVPGLKESAFPLLVEALESEIARTEQAFQEKESALAKVVEGLGYPANSPQALQLIRTDPARRDLMLVAKDTRRLKSSGVYALTAEDSALTAEIHKAIGAMLK